MSGVARVLIAEDEFLIAELLGEMVRDLGLEVCGIADHAAGAVALAAQERPELVLMDARLRAGSDGVEAAAAIAAAYPCTIMFVTGSQETATVKRMQAQNPAAILFKPISFAVLAQTIEAVLRQPAP